MKKEWNIGDLLEFEHNGKKYKSILTKDEGWKLHPESPTKEPKRHKLSTKKVRFPVYKHEIIPFKKILSEDIQEILNQFHPTKKHKTPPNFNPIEEIQEAWRSLIVDYEQQNLPLARKRLELESLQTSLMTTGRIIALLDQEILNELGLNILWQESKSKELLDLGISAAIRLKEFPKSGRKSHEPILNFIYNLGRIYETLVGKRATYGTYFLSKKTGGNYKISNFMSFAKSVLSLINPTILEMLSDSGFSSKVKKALKRP